MTTITTNKNYATLTGWLIAIWFVFSIAASALHVYRNEGAQPPLPVAISALVPLVIFWLWYRLSPGFRAFALALDPRTLTMVQSWRIAGYVFVVLEAYRILPAVFAMPAGYGDIFIGATAFFAASALAQPSNKAAFIVWQLLGVTDLVTAVTLGSIVSRVTTAAIPAAPMTVLPLSLIPTFAVPLFLILHFICIAQARRWSTANRDTNRTQPLAV